MDVKQLSKTARFVPESLFSKRQQSRDNEIHQLLSRTAFRIRVCFGPKRGSGFGGETGGEIPKAQLRPIESLGGEPTQTDFFTSIACSYTSLPLDDENRNFSFLFI